MAGETENWRLILDAAQALTAAGQTPFTRISVYEEIWRRHPRSSHDRPSLDPTFQGMVRNATGGPRSRAGTPLVRVDRGRYVLAGDGGAAEAMRQTGPPAGIGRERSATPADGVFISYRREDAGYPAGWLFGELVERFGAARVFQDVDSIEPGDDFAEKITAAVSSCAALLAVIGPRWLTAADEDGQRRLDDPADFVRLEIESALTRGVRVIPVLVDSARMPRREQLPASLGMLVTRQAVELSPTRFRADLGPLINVLNRALASQSAALTQELSSPLEPAHTSGLPPARALERQQADQVSMLPSTIDGAQALVLPGDATEPVHMLVVTNGSKRPIRNVVAKIEATPVGATTQHDKLADNTGELIAVQIASAAKADTFKPGDHGSKTAVLRAGQRTAFVWNFTVARYPHPSFALRFTDDNELDWEIDNNLRLAKLPGREGW